MIGDIRKTLKTTKVKLLIWASLASIVGGGSIALLLSRLTGGRPDRVATVNGHDISYLEFARKLNEIQGAIAQVRQTQGVDAENILKMWGLDGRPDEFALDMLVGEKVLKSATNRLGTQVHPEYVQDKLSDQFFVYQNLRGIIPPQALRGGTIDVRALEQNLQRQGISMSDFDEILQDALLRVFMFNLVEAGLYLPDAAVKDAYIARDLKKKYAYLPLSRASYVAKAKQTSLSDQEVASYYEKKENQESYRVPEKRSAKVWTFTPEKFGLIIADAEVKDAYNKKRRSYIKKPAQVEVQHILLPFDKDTKVTVRATAQEIFNKVKESPDTFAQVAAEKSSSTDKGSTITLKRTDKNPAFSNAAFSLDINGISPVVETADGFEIIKLIKKIQPEYKALDEVKEQLAKELKEEKFARIFSANAQRVVSQASDAPAFLTKFIEQHKGQLSTVKRVTSANEMQNQHIFKVRRIGDRAFYQDGGKGYIIEVTEIEPSKVPPLDSIKSTVTENIYKERALNAVSADLKEGLTALRTGKMTLSQVAQSLNGTVDITDWITLSDKESLKPFNDKKIDVSLLEQLTKVGAAASDVTATHGYLIQVKQMAELKPEEYEKEKARIRQRLARKEGEALSAAFAQSLKDNATISRNEELLGQIR